MVKHAIIQPWVLPGDRILELISGILYNGMGDSIVINPAKWISSGRRLELVGSISLAKQPRRHLEHLTEKIIVSFIQKSGQRNSAIGTEINIYMAQHRNIVCF